MSKRHCMNGPKMRRKAAKRERKLAYRAELAARRAEGMLPFNRLYNNSADSWPYKTKLGERLTQISNPPVNDSAWSHTFTEGRVSAERAEIVTGRTPSREPNVSNAPASVPMFDQGSFADQALREKRREAAKRGAATRAANKATRGA